MHSYQNILALLMKRNHKHTDLCKNRDEKFAIVNTQKTASLIC